MATITDTFNRANGALGGSTTSDGTAVWTVHSGGFAIASNQAAATQPTDNLATIDTGAAGGTAQVTTPVLQAANRSGLLIRYQDNSNFFAIEAATGGSAGWVIYRQGGVDNIITTFTGVAGDVYSAVCSGSTITFKRNGTTLATDASGLFSTATRFGLVGTASSGQTFDDWSFVGTSAPAWRRPNIFVRPRAVSRAAVI